MAKMEANAARSPERILGDAQALATLLLQLRVDTLDEHLRSVETMIRFRTQLSEIIDELKWRLPKARQSELRARVRSGCAEAKAHEDGRAKRRSTPGTGLNDTSEEAVEALTQAVLQAGEPLRVAARRLGVIYSAASLFVRWQRNIDERAIADKLLAQDRRHWLLGGPRPTAREPDAKVIQLFPRPE
jgi:hypothetical protein